MTPSTSISTRNMMALLVLLLAGCTDISVDPEEPSPGQGGAAGTPNAAGGASSSGGAAGGAALEWPGESLGVTLPASAHVTLGELELTQGEAVPGVWDLRFDGSDVYTNSGASGDGLGGAFGPLAREDFFSGGYPEVPFLFTDEPSGALGGWYAYEGTSHTLYSRFHTYAIHSGASFYKLQVLSYYGSVQGAPLSAVYSVRYAKVEPQHNHELQVVEQLDATAGWPAISDSSPSACLRLEDGERLALTPSQAQSRADWDLCFRRDTLTINGGAGGPGGVTAVDLDGDDTREIEAVQQLSAEDTLADFEAIAWPDLSDPSLDYRGDRVVSAFTDAWLESTDPPRLAEAAWLVIDHAGAPYLVAFSQDTPTSPEKLTLHLRALDP